MKENESSGAVGANLRLFLFSLVSLFLELLVIRWMAADIRAFTIFKSFPLVTFYIGLGLGFAFGGNKRARYFPFALVLFAIEMQVAAWLHFGELAFPSNSHDWYSHFAQSYILSFLVQFGLILAVPLFLSFTVGSALAPVFAELPPLRAYSVNLVGALAGSVLFAALTFGNLPPAVLLIIPACIMLLLFDKPGKSRLIAIAVSGLALLLGFKACQIDSNNVFWSPYQRLDLSALKYEFKNCSEPPARMFDLDSNHVFYQRVSDLTPERLKRLLAAGIPSLNFTGELAQFRWMLPFQLHQGKDNLVVAAGMGSDVSQGLLLQDGSIDAVDIDPLIIQLGREVNPLKPYSSPRVQVFCDDARHYFATCKKKYDLIVFSHLDSHTVLGNSSSARLDNYIYTKQGLSQAIRLMKPDGMLVMSFWSGKPWFTQRLYNTICQAAGYAPLVLGEKIKTPEGSEVTPDTVFVLGESVRKGSFSLPQSIGDSFVPLNVKKTDERILTDDWPFLYLEDQLFDPIYLAVLGEMVLICFFCSRGLLLKPAPAVHWQLFFMGAAFMLLELQFISRLSLLFGATWITTSIVINGVLLMILGANVAVMKRRDWFTGKLNALYLLLIVSLIGSYFLPVSMVMDFYSEHTWLAYLIICLITFLPVLMAGIIFAVSFDKVKDSRRALAFNILGAVLGALLEYISNYTGINALLVVVMILYGLSYLFCRLEKKAA